MPRRLLFSFLASLLLHLLVGLLSGPLWEDEIEDERFRARLVRPPRFMAPPKLPVPNLELPEVHMERLASEAAPRQIPDSDLSPPAEELAERPFQTLSDTPVGESQAPKSSEVQLAEEVLPSPTELAAFDALESEAMDLLRIGDMAQADRYRAVIFENLQSRRDVRGYVNITMLQLNGVWSYDLVNVGADGDQGNPISVLPELTRYLRDYTQILARIRPHQAHYQFIDEELLKDPIHFMFPGVVHNVEAPLKRVVLNVDELALLERYLRGGGFIWIDAGGGSDDRRFLMEMVDYLRQMLGGAGRLFEVPTSHPVYHSFYDYESGFPGEYKREVSQIPTRRWYYPERSPEAELYPRGLWGVQLGDRVVGLISDFGLHRHWRSDADTTSATESENGGGEGQEEAPAPSSPLLFLQAATNIVVYALTRPEGLTRKLPMPVWRQQRPSQVLAALDVGAEEVDDSGIYDALDASLALVHAPLGSRMEESGLRLRLDGKYALEVFKGDISGVLLRNVPVGQHWLEVEYRGEQQGVSIELEGDRVLTVAFLKKGLPFFELLQLNPQEEQVEVEDWLHSFSDLEVEEIYYETAEDGLD